MKLSEIKVFVRYWVTKPSKCNTLEAGDRVKLEQNGDLMVDQGGGWLDREIVNKLNDVEVEVYRPYYEDKLSQLRAEILEIQNILEGCDG